MSFNITAYIIYFSLITYIIAVVGKSFYKNGRVFILALFRGDDAITDKLNMILLVAYYLFNIGFALYILEIYPEVTGVRGTIEALSAKLGGFSIYLGFMLFFNVYLFFRGKKIAKQKHRETATAQRVDLNPFK